MILKIEKLSVNPKKRNRAYEIKNPRFIQDKMSEMCKRVKMMKIDELSED